MPDHNFLFEDTILVLLSEPYSRPSKMASCMANQICVVCCHETKIWAMGECNHPTCLLCSARLRVLCGQNDCPVCRMNLKEVCGPIVRQVLYCHVTTSVKMTCSCTVGCSYGGSSTLPRYIFS